MPAEKPTWPEAVEKSLANFSESAQSALGPDLKAIVVYGSAAESKLRKTSDVNLIVVLSQFEASKVDKLREPYRTAHAAVDLEAMFVLESELALAVEAFAVKFADVIARRYVLYGADPFTGLAPTRAAEIARLRQVLLNLVLRLRQRYLLRSLRDEQVAPMVADAAGPLRSAAHALLQLQGQSPPSPKEALATVARAWGHSGWEAMLESISTARETGSLPPGVGVQTVLRILELGSAMVRQVETLR